MGSLSDIANVQIALNTTAVRRADFGTPLIASPLASFTSRVRVYDKEDSTNPDNLPQAVLTALSDAFAQIPHPRFVKVGRLSIDKAVIQPSIVTNTAVYSLKIDATLVSFTSSASATAANISTGVAAAINTAALGVTATAVGGTVEIVFSGAVKAITTFTKLEWGTITPSAVGGIMATDLGAINQEDSEWYSLQITERTKTRILAAADWVEANEKLFITASADSDILTAGIDTDTVGALKAAGYFRTAAMYHTKASSEYPDVAWASRVLTIKAGGETWAHKRLNSVSPDKLTATDVQTIFAKNGNVYQYYHTNVALTNNGTVAGGEWIDIIRFRDYLKDLIQTNVVMFMIKKDKVPYTDQGLQAIGNVIRASLRTGQQVGGIAPDEIDADGNVVPGFNLTIPLSSEVDDVTKASRVAYFTFNARLAGAIHLADITGGLAYSLD